MEHNPYYNESLGQSHIDPNAALAAAQLHSLQVQETDRLRQLDHQAHGSFAGLQSLTDQYAPQHHAHNGPGWGGVAAGAVAGYYLANRQQAPARPSQPMQTRPVGWKGNVWGWYFALALLIQLAIWPSIAIAGGGAGAFLALGSAVWVPAWLVILVHQSAIREHNRKLPKN